MSRRKQSNPKPLKSEQQDKAPVVPSTSPLVLPLNFCKDTEEEEPPQSPIGDEDSNDSASTAIEGSQHTEASRGHSSPLTNKESDSSRETIGPPVPRIRLKTNLATDPAAQVRNGSGCAPTEDEQFPISQVAGTVRGFVASSPTEPSTTTTRQNLFTCPPCGIRFSSRSTLEAHQTFYCSHRANAKPPIVILDDDKPTTAATGSDSDVTIEEQPKNSVVEPPSKTARTGKQYTCTHCTYSADKKVSLNRHMRMHTVSPNSNASSSVMNGIPEDVTQGDDRYCAECDIRFSSMKTYRAHKLHYCNSRHLMKTAQTAAPLANKITSGGSAPTSPNLIEPRTPSQSPQQQQQQQQQPFIALPTNPIIIVPYSLIRGASILPNVSIPAPDTPCFLLPNGTLQPMVPSGSGQLDSKLTSLLPPPSVKDLTVRTISPHLLRESSSTPLDLSVRRRTPEAIVRLATTPTASVTISPVAMTKSPKPGISPKPQTVRKPSTPEPTAHSNPTVPNFDLPLLMRSAMFPHSATDVIVTPVTTSTVQPQVLVKQGVSKCKECNIVFCKHENYVIHKKHYCAARQRNSIDTDNEDYQTAKVSGQQQQQQQQQTTSITAASAVSIGNTRNHNSPPISPQATSPHYQQLICAACGIKFTSLDNLNAHQSYYCLKRNSVADAPEKRCQKCRIVLGEGLPHQCQQLATLPPPSRPPSSNSAPTPGWRCPCCDVVCPTASAAQRHLDTHTAVKAYRCTICKYKGNTLRGMRTHIRMHFDKRTPDLQEEKYITYILEDDYANMLEVNMADSPPSPATDLSPIQHQCPHCLYTSQYRANVMRHIKVAHSKEETIDDCVNGTTNDTKFAIDQNVDDDDTVDTDTDESLTVVRRGEKLLMVKREAIEPEVILRAVSRSSSSPPESNHRMNNYDEVEDQLNVNASNRIEVKQEDNQASPVNNNNNNNSDNDNNNCDNNSGKEEGGRNGGFSGCAPSTSAGEETANAQRKYCKSCDISFTYYSTFVAHKKFYCSSHVGELDTTSTSSGDTHNNNNKNVNNNNTNSNNTTSSKSHKTSNGTSAAAVSRATEASV